MGAYRLDGSEIHPHEVVGTHGYRTCEHPGCSSIIERWEPSGDGDLLRHITCTASGLVLDSHWRFRCDQHNDRLGDTQLQLF